MDELILLLNLQAQTTFGNAGGSQCKLINSVTKDSKVLAELTLQSPDEKILDFGLYEVIIRKKEN